MTRDQLAGELERRHDLIPGDRVGGAAAEELLVPDRRTHD